MPAAPAERRVLAIRPDDERARSIAESVSRLPWTSRAELIGVQGGRVGSGRSDGEFWQAGPWFVKSRRDRRFPRADAAIEAADRLLATKRRLGSLMPAHSVLVVIDRGDGPQLFTVTPLLITLREQLDAAAAGRRWGDFALAIAAFAIGLGETVRLSLEQSLGLDASPANFATQGARLRYLDDDVASTQDAIGVEDAFVVRFTEYAPPAAIWDAYVAHTAAELRARTSARDRARLGLARRFTAAAQLRRGTITFVERLLALIEAA